MSEKKQRASATSSTKGSTLKDKTKKDTTTKLVKEKENVQLPPVSPSKKTVQTSTKRVASEKKQETKPKAGGIVKGGSGLMPNEKKATSDGSQAAGASAETSEDSPLPQLVKTSVVSSVEVTADSQDQDQDQPKTLPEKETYPSQTETISDEAEAVKKAKEQEKLEAIRKEKGNGMVKLIYEQYDELFPIVDGSTTQANIDEVYCLSFVMPNCKVRLSYHSNPERLARENDGIFDSLIEENPSGTYQNLKKDQTYYIVVEQEEDQLKRDQEATKARWQPVLKEEEAQKQLKKNDGRGFETCSCIYGNPCVDEYGCKDWHSRFAIATTNGWKGF